MKAETFTTREVFTPLSKGRKDWHFAVRPGDGTVEIVYLEADVEKARISIEAEASQELAAAIALCGGEVMAKEKNA